MQKVTNKQTVQKVNSRFLQSCLQDQQQIGRSLQMSQKFQKKPPTNAYLTLKSQPAFGISHPQRNFSGKLDLKMSKQFGQGDIGDEEFLPDQEERDIEHNIKISSSLSISKRPDEMLKHNEEIGGKIYKYDLPVQNETLVFKNETALILQEEELGQTPAMNLFEQLEVDLDTAFESFVIKHHQMYNNEIDMYGDIKQAGDSSLKVLDFGIPIPFEYVNDEALMKRTRSYFRVNTDIPGSIEVVHPNKFLPNLRPVEDFRHTPIIPISEKDMRKHQESIDQRNRKGYYVEIRKDTIYFYTIASLTLGIIFYAFLMVNEKQMRIKEQIERTKTLRLKATQGGKGANLAAERDREDMIGGSRKLM